jgi:hypothetical protein
MVGDVLYTFSIIVVAIFCFNCFGNIIFIGKRLAIIGIQKPDIWIPDKYNQSELCVRYLGLDLHNKMILLIQVMILIYKTIIVYKTVYIDERVQCSNGGLKSIPVFK